MTSLAIGVVVAACGRDSIGLHGFDPPDRCAFAIQTTVLPQGRVGEPYQASVRSLCGADPIRWSTPDPLPNGLTMISGESGAAHIIGSPLEDFDGRLQIYAADALGGRAEVSLRLRILKVQDQLRIETSELPRARVGDLYQASILGRGGDPAYRWTIARGRLPLGLRLDEAGTPETFIRGMAQRGDEGQSFDVQLTDASGDTAVRTFILSVDADDPLRITTDALPSGILGARYSATLEAAGGIPPLQWSAWAAPLPDGLAISNGVGTTGLISGIPQVEGRFVVGVQVQDSAGGAAMRSLQLVVDSALPLEIVTDELPIGNLGAPYAGAIEARGGLPPYAWSVVSGTLDSGLSLDAAGTPATALSGTPTVIATREITVRVVDAAGDSFDATFTLEIRDALPPLEIVTPSLSAANTCLHFADSLFARGGTEQGYSWSVTQGNLPPGIRLDSVGTPVARISGAPTAAGSYSFTVSVVDDAGNVAHRSLSIVVVEVGAPRWAVLVGDLTVDSQDDAYAVDVCGSTPGPAHRLGPLPGGGSVRPSHQNVAISPDGRKLAFLGNGPVGFSDLWIVDLSGVVPGAPTSVTGSLLPAGTSVSSFAWSPDSSALAFVANPNGVQRTLWIAPIGALGSPGTPQLMSPGMIWAGNVETESVKWSPDSTRIAYLADAAENGRIELWAVTLTQSGPSSPIRVNAAFASPNVQTDFAWAGNSSSLLYRAREAGSARLELRLARLSQTGAVVARAPVNGPLADPNSFVIQFAVSPDERFVVYLADESVVGIHELHTVDISGTTPGPSVKRHLQLTATQRVGGAWWSPDSTRIAFLGSLNTVNVSEAFVADVADPAGVFRVASGVLTPGGSIVADLEWSPDARWIGYIADQLVDQRVELFVVDTLSPVLTPIRINPTPVSQGGVLDRFTFAPDGSQVAFIGDLSRADEHELFLADVAGQIPGPARRVNTVLPMGGDVENDLPKPVKWKRDSSAVFYRADQTTNDQVEAWMAPVFDGASSAPARMNPPITGPLDVRLLAFSR